MPMLWVLTKLRWDTMLIIPILLDVSSKHILYNTEPEEGDKVSQGPLFRTMDETTTQSNMESMTIQRLQVTC